MVITSKRKRAAGGMARITDYTPIGQWLIKQCERRIDPHTHKPITWRHASIEAQFKDPNAIWRFITKRHTPDPESCYKLALFFSVPPDRIVNPDYLLYLAGHRLDPVPEYIPKTIHLDDTQQIDFAVVDKIFKAEYPELYQELGDFLREATYEDVMELIVSSMSVFLTLFKRRDKSHDDPHDK